MKITTKKKQRELDKIALDKMIFMGLVVTNSKYTNEQLKATAQDILLADNVIL